MKLDVTVDGAAKLNKSMMEYMELFSNNVGETIQQHAKLIAQDFMYVTPPFVNKQGGNSQADRKIGEKAVERDLTAAITPSDVMFSDEFTNKRVEEIVRRKKYDAMNKVLDASPKLGGWKAVPFNPKYHLENRSRGGRFRFPKPLKIMTMDIQKWRRYLRDLLKRVGWVKGGWGLCVAALGGAVPGWIGRHTAGSRGQISIRLATEPSLLPSVEMSNEVPYADHLNHRYNFAMNRRADLMQKEITIKLQKILRKINSRL